MKVIDPGHTYEVATYDGDGQVQIITFMKREGEGYPGNVGSYPGTNCQELLRVIIDRLWYLNRQIPHQANTMCIDNLELCIKYLEQRAAKLHEVEFKMEHEAIEYLATCKVCGHITCKGH